MDQPNAIVATPTPEPVMDRPASELSQDDASTFLGAPPPAEIARQARQAAPAKAKPQAAPAPAPAPEAPKVSSYMLGMARDAGMTNEEAQEFGSDENLARGIRIANRYRQQAQPQKQEPAPKQEKSETPDLEIPELDERYDPGLVKMSKALKHIYGQIKDLVGLKDKLPEMVAQHHHQMTAQQRVTQMLQETAKESGYSQKIDDSTQRQILQLASGLHESYKRGGQKPPEDKVLIQNVLSLVLGKAAGTPASPNTPPNVDAQRSALAGQRNRDTATGQFTEGKPVGAPTHRVSALPKANGSNLRDTILDKGGDPGIERPDSDDESTFFPSR